MKVVFLLKHNIDTLLKARGQTRHDLAVWCRRSDAWLSKILSESDANNQKRSVPLKYLDRIADFFGIATYQLLQPGISSLTERRQSADRRSGQDRRVSRAFPAVNGPTEADLLRRLRLLTTDERQKLDHWIDVLRLGRDDAPGTATRRGRGTAAESPAAEAPRRRGGASK